MRCLLFSFVALFLTLSPVAGAEPLRVALLIGNSDYDRDGTVNPTAAPTDGHARDLRNAASDVADVGAALRQAGYETRVLTNATLAETSEAVDWLGAKARNAGPSDVFVFYFAGHGVTVNTLDYLVPAGARIPSMPDTGVLSSEAALRTAMGLPDPQRDAALSTEFFPTMRLRAALPDRIHGQGPARVFFFDNCRNNPFDAETSGWALFFAQRSTLSLIGLAIGVDTPVFVFSATPPQLALDGAGRNSPFAAALKGRIGRPAQNIVQLVDAVRNDVGAATGGTQRPDALGSVREISRVCLVGCPPQ